MHKLRPRFSVALVCFLYHALDVTYKEFAGALGVEEQFDGFVRVLEQVIQDCEAFQLQLLVLYVVPFRSGKGVYQDFVAFGVLFVELLRDRFVCLQVIVECIKELPELIVIVFLYFGIYQLRRIQAQK